MGQFLKPEAGAFLDGVAVLLELGVFGWVGGNVGEGIEYGVGVGAEFLAVAGEAGGKIRGKGVEVFFPGGFFVRLGNRKA